MKTLIKRKAPAAPRPTPVLDRETVRASLREPVSSPIDATAVWLARFKGSHQRSLKVRKHWRDRKAA
jgi:hypothetical protein